LVNSTGSSKKGNTHNLEVVGSKPIPGMIFKKMYFLFVDWWF